MRVPYLFWFRYVCSGHLVWSSPSKRGGIVATVVQSNKAKLVDLERKFQENTGNGEERSSRKADVGSGRTLPGA